MKFSVCLDMNYVSLPFEERIEIAKKLKIDAFEFWKWTNKDISLLKNSGLDIRNFKFITNCNIIECVFFWCCSAIIICLNIIFCCV